MKEITIKSTIRLEREMDFNLDRAPNWEGKKSATWTQWWNQAAAHHKFTDDMDVQPK